MNSAKLSLLRHAGVVVLILSFAATTHGQGASSTPIKQGLWQTQVTSTVQMALPPDLQAKIAAMPPAQQAQMQAMMGGGMGAGKPTSSTVKSCVATTTTLNDLYNQAQQKSGMKCTFSNLQQTANSMSFDISCTSAQGSGSGHAQFTMTDSEHGTGTTHLTIAASSNGHSMNATMDGASTYTYLGADCGDVKPNTAGQ